MSLRIAFIGCVESSRVALATLLALPPRLARVVAVVTRRQSALHADHVDLTSLAVAHGVAVLHVEDKPSDEEQAGWLRDFKVDLAFCVGWSRLLGPKMLAVAPRGTVGFHPAALPANRGRHPLIWALALGLSETGSTFFLLRADADSGPVLSQVPIRIEPEDDASTLYSKLVAAIPQQIETIVRGLLDDTLRPMPQDDARANHWRKRGFDDGRIDWRMPATGIRNLVRALTRPYPGAHFMHGDEAVKVWRCAVVEGAAANLEPGKVLDADGRFVTVKCGDGAICLTEHDLQCPPLRGSYL